MHNRKRHVLEHAQQLFLEKGVAATSIQDIIQKAKISKGTFYNYFASKNDCLKAIVVLSEEETNLRREELLIGQDPSDQQIFIQQVAVRTEVTNDYNLLPILETIFNSGDEDLSQFARNSHLKELAWIANRFVDLYGERMKDYATDCAVLFVGMLQHTLYFSRSNRTPSYSVAEVTKYIMRRIDHMIPSMAATEDALFGDSLFQVIQTNDQDDGAFKQEVMDRLSAFEQQLTREKDTLNLQYVRFLIDELDEAAPRLQLIESVLRSFRQAFEQTPHEFTVIKIVSDIWVYIQAECSKENPLNS